MSHCVKSAQIQSFSGPNLPVFGLNTGKYGPQKTPYFNTFHTVSMSNSSYFSHTSSNCGIFYFCMQKCRLMSEFRMLHYSWIKASAKNKVQRVIQEIMRTFKTLMLKWSMFNIQRLKNICSEKHMALENCL